MDVQTQVIIRPTSKEVFDRLTGECMEEVVLI